MHLFISYQVEWTCSTHSRNSPPHQLQRLLLFRCRQVLARGESFHRSRCYCVGGGFTWLLGRYKGELLCSVHICPSPDVGVHPGDRCRSCG